jgi:hypothetical protein
MGANGRAYAERAFDLERIADAFEKVLLGAGEADRSSDSQVAYRTAALGIAPATPQLR